jgi:hypothetical protein
MTDENNIFIELQLQIKNYKKCPHCQTITEKNGGCNYLECLFCKKPWCWKCCLIKYKISGCDDKTHDSH